VGESPVKNFQKDAGKRKFIQSLKQTERKSNFRGRGIARKRMAYGTMGTLGSRIQASTRQNNQWGPASEEREGGKGKKKTAQHLSTPREREDHPRGVNEQRRANETKEVLRLAGSQGGALCLEGCVVWSFGDQASSGNNKWRYGGKRSGTSEQAVQKASKHGERRKIRRWGKKSIPH